MAYTPPELPPFDIDGEIPAAFGEDEQPAKPPWLRRFLIEAIETVVLAVILFLIINAVSARIRVDGQSMEPTFHDGNYVIVYRLAYRFGDFQRGDVIVFSTPGRFSEDLIKRVIGLPGDRVRINDGDVFVNDVILTEPYINARTALDLREVIVPPGTIYVLGDNRNASSDSRQLGPIAMAEVVGRAIFVYWPFDVFGIIQHFEYGFPE